MSSEYAKAIQWLEDNTLFLSPGLRKNRVLDSSVREYYRAVAEVLGNPQRAFPVIQIAGSKGKGTTAYLISHLLVQAGYRVGLAMSPHLTDQRERALLNFCMASREVFGKAVNEVAAACGRVSGKPTYSGVMSMVALHLFRELSAEIAVVECGLGGANDSTGFLENEIAVLTSIELEHTLQLGNSLEGIAQEKAAIVSQRGLLVAPVFSKDIASAVKDTVVSHYAELVTVPFAGCTARERCIALARVAAERFLTSRGQKLPLCDTSKVEVPGRRDLRVVGDCKVLFDGAHTRESIALLAQELPTLLPEKPRLVFSVTHGRNPEPMLEILESVVSSGYFIGESSLHSLPSWVARFPSAELHSLFENGTVLVTGSFHLAGDVMQKLRISPFSELPSY